MPQTSTPSNQLVVNAPIRLQTAPEPEQKPDNSAFGLISQMSHWDAIREMQDVETKLFYARKYFFKHYRYRKQKGIEDWIQEAYRHHIWAIDMALSLIKQLITEMLMEINQSKNIAEKGAEG